MTHLAEMDHLVIELQSDQRKLGVVDDEHVQTSHNTASGVVWVALGTVGEAAEVDEVATESGLNRVLNSLDRIEDLGKSIQNLGNPRPRFQYPRLIDSLAALTCATLEGVSPQIVRHSYQVKDCDPWESLRVLMYVIRCINSCSHSSKYTTHVSLSSRHSEQLNGAVLRHSTLHFHMIGYTACDQRD